MLRRTFQRELESKKLEEHSSKEQGNASLSYGTDGLDDTQGQLAFNTLNRVVQFMMSLNVPHETIENLATQLIATRQFNDDYVVLVQDMIAYLFANHDVA